MTSRSLGSILAMLLLAACSRSNEPAAQEAVEPPTLDVTSWTDKSELFMEYPPLVAGETVRFAVHLTRVGVADGVEADRGEEAVAVLLDRLRTIRSRTAQVE